MTTIQLLNTFLVTSSWFIGSIAVYKSLKPKKLAFFSPLMLFASLFCLYYLFCASDILSSYIPNMLMKQQIFVLLVILLFILYITLCFKSGLTEKMSVMGIYVIICMLLEIALNFAVFIFGFDTKDFLNPSLRFTITVYGTYFIFNLIFSISAYFIYKKHKIHAPWQVLAAVICVMLSCTFMFMMVINPYRGLQNTDSYIYNALTSAVCLVVLIFSIIITTKYMSMQQRLKEKYSWIEHMQNLDIKHSEVVQQKSEEIRRIQHDFKDSLVVLKKLIESGGENEIQEANLLINSLNSKIEKSKIIFYTDNITVNSVVSSKVAEAWQDGIKIEPDIRIPEKTGDISDLDLMILTINLLNNAIEACKGISESEKVIEIKMSVRANLLIIKTINPYSKLNFDNKGKIASTRDDAENHGIGMGIIKDITEKYNGNQSFGIERNKFAHIVALVMNK